MCNNCRKTKLEQKCRSEEIRIEALQVKLDERLALKSSISKQVSILINLKLSICLVLRRKAYHLLRFLRIV